MNKDKLEQLQRELERLGDTMRRRGRTFLVLRRRPQQHLAHAFREFRDLLCVLEQCVDMGQRNRVSPSSRYVAG